MRQLFSPRVQHLTGASCLALLAALLVFFAKEFQPDTKAYEGAIVSAGGFLAAAVLVFAAWACAGPVYGVASVGLALAIAAASYGELFDAVKAATLAAPVAAAAHFRSRVREMVQSYEVREERLDAELAELRKATAEKEARRRSYEQRAARLPRLRQACQALGASLDPAAARRVAVKEVAGVLDNAERVLLFLAQEGELRVAAAYPTLSPERLQACQAQEADRFVFENVKPYLCPRVSGDVYRFTESEPGKPASFAATPLCDHVSVREGDSQRPCVGVLRVTSSQPDAFGRADLDMLNVVGALAGMALQNAELYHRCKMLAITDALTGLSARWYFQERFVEELARSRREQASLAFLMIDIDNFKAYNDTYGHSAGDEVLRDLADVLRRHSEIGDLLARYGGEEFAAVRQTDYESALAWAESLRAGVEQARLGSQADAPRLTISIGVSAAPQHGERPDELIAYADKAMYRAKQAGKNRVC